MKFQEKYTSLSEKDIIENKDKKIISDDAFAVGEMIEGLTDSIRNIGVSMR